MPSAECTVACAQFAAFNASLTLGCVGAVRCLLRMYRRARLHKIEDHVMSVLDDADAQARSIASGRFLLLAPTACRH